MDKPHTIVSKFLENLVNTQVFIALGIVSLTIMAAILLRLRYDFPIFLLIFSGTSLSYTINRMADTQEDAINSPKRLLLLNKYRALIYIYLPIFLASFFYVSFLNWVVGLITTINILIAVIYSIGFPMTGLRKLKATFGVKNAVISTVWATSLLILGAYNSTFSAGLLLLTVFVFMRIFLGSVLFDIRDMRGDTALNIKTIPTTWGVKKALQFCWIINIASVLLIFVAVILGTLPPQAYLLLLIALYQIYPLLTITSESTDKEFLCGVIVDGEYLLLGILAFLGKTVIR